MPFETALRLTEILLGLALVQQSLEHMLGPMRDRWLFGLRALASLALLVGGQGEWALPVLAGLSLVMLWRFQGPYNGGSDKMSLLVLWCLTGATLWPVPLGQELFLAYLAVQLTLSYFVSGRVKLVNPAWRDGSALRDVFAFSAYPVSEGLRQLADRPHALRLVSWSVIVLEVLFPLALSHKDLLLIALALMALFHLANAMLFGLNRFFWIWLAAYPSLIWFQARFLLG